MKRPCLLGGASDWHSVLTLCCEAGRQRPDCRCTGALAALDSDTLAVGRAMGPQHGTLRVQLLHCAGPRGRLHLQMIPECDESGQGLMTIK